MAYRSTPIEATGVSPAQLIMGQKIRTVVLMLPKGLDPEWPDGDEVQLRNSNYKERSKRYYDYRHSIAPLPKLHTGDTVRIKTDKDRFWSDLGTVRQADHENQSYVVETPKGLYRRNRKHLQPIQNNSTETSSHTGVDFPDLNPVNNTRTENQLKDVSITLPVPNSDSNQRSFIFYRPLLKEEIQAQILEKLKSTFEPLGIDQKKFKSKKLREQAIAINEAESVQRRKLRSTLLFGVGAVTRAVEKDNARLILVSQQVEPVLLTKHLITLCAVRKCPAICLRELAAVMMPVLNFTSLITMGFKKTEEDTPFEDFIKFATELAPVIVPAWLDIDDSLEHNVDPKTYIIRGGEGTIHIMTESHATGVESHATGAESHTTDTTQSNNTAVDKKSCGSSTQGASSLCDYSRFYVYKNRKNFDGADFIAFNDSPMSVDIESTKREMSSLGETTFGSGTVETFVTPRIGYAKYKQPKIKRLKPNLNKVKKKNTKIKKKKSK
ncbi:hypothetical protein ScPMuIL_018976 [Solemya velum]